MRRTCRLAVAAAAAAIAALAPATASADVATLSLRSGGPQDGGADSRDVSRGGAVSSFDGSRVWFQTLEPLVPEDGDGISDFVVTQDVYEHSGGVTKLISDRVQPGADYATPANIFSATPDGGRVLLWTAEALLASDTDPFNSSGGRYDLYVNENGTLKLITDTPGGPPDGDFDTGFATKASQDLSKVAFSTKEPLLASDSDTAYDTYLSTNGTITHLSDRVLNPASDQAIDALPVAISGDGARVLFQTKEPLVSGDTDTEGDLYMREGATTALLSDRVNNPAGDQNKFAHYAASSSDGSVVFMLTREALTADDGDANSYDLYKRAGGVTTLVSDRVQLGADAALDVANQDSEVQTSSDGSRVFFQTDEPLVAADTDTARDVYERSGGTTKLVSDSPQDVPKPATLRRITPDGSRVYFLTSEALVSDDGDTAQDVYERFADGTKLVSDRAQPGADEAIAADINAVSSDGSRLLIRTDEALTCVDKDASLDVFARVNGVTTAISDTSDTNSDAEQDAFPGGLSGDGLHAFLITAEPLLAADQDSTSDLYSAVVGAGASPCDPKPPPGGGDPPPGGGDPPPGGGGGGGTPPPPPPGPTVTGPAGNPLGLPTRRRCVDTRKFSFRLHHAPGARIVKVEVFINGKRKLVKRGTNITRLTLKRLPKKKFRVRIVATQNTGSKLISVRTYKGCKKSKSRTRRGGRRRR